ncbi:hypothetical protein HZA44_00275 [Candidatus Peregrinibacteria bacterium]|nr:hypothetical protein [Candidatus Peregrinibacteria bacterium]
MMHFPGQRADEEVLHVIHKHPVVYIKIALGFLLFVLVPLSAFAFFWFRFYPLESFYRQGLIAGIFASFYFLFGLLVTYIDLTDEQFDVFIITTDRLIDITQISFFKRSVSSASLEQIQDTTGMINGFFPTLFHYGDLTVQTSAAEGSTFKIDHIADPDGVGKRILEIARHRQKPPAHPLPI